MDKKSGSGSGMNNLDHIAESLETTFWVKILKFFGVDPGSGMGNILGYHRSCKDVRPAIATKHCCKSDPNVCIRCEKAEESKPKHSVLRIRNVYPGSRIRFFLSQITDPGLTRSGIRFKEFIIFLHKN